MELSRDQKEKVPRPGLASICAFPPPPPHKFPFELAFLQSILQLKRKFDWLPLRKQSHCSGAHNYPGFGDLTLIHLSSCCAERGYLVKMSNQFIGLTMLVTLNSPPGAQLRGIVNSIEPGKSLTLRDGELAWR